MQDRETALKEQENAREWQAIAYGDHPATWAALAYYRERGWPVDANTFPERDRCENRIFAFKAGYAAALASPLSAPPQVDVVALARAYRALVEHVAEQQATPDESWRAQADSLDRMLELEAALTKAALDKAKRRALTVFDTWLRVTGAMPAGSSWVCEAESCIEDAVEIGVQAAYGIHRPLGSESDAAPPQEPTGASPQAETRRDCTCLGTCRGAEGLGPRWKCALETPAPVSPVEPPSEDEDDDVPLLAPEGAMDSWSAPLRKPVPLKILSTDDFYALLRILEVLPADPFLSALQAKLSDEERRQHGNQASHLSGPEFVREIERVEALIQSRVQPPALSPVEPTPEPETCAWKFASDDSGMWETACGRFWEFNEDGPKENRVHFCFFCGKPLRLVPSEER